MAPPRLTISSIKSVDELETCVPNLMPFHIDYNGKAPMAKYFRVEPAKETVGAPSPEPSKAEADGEPESQEGAEASGAPEPAVVAPAEKSPKPTLVAPPSPSLARRVASAATRFISTFRGRTIQGLKVDLPPGYVGLILRADDENITSKGGDYEDGVEKKSKANGKRKAKPKSSKGRATRSTTRAFDVDEDMDVDMAEGTERFRNEEETGAPPDQTPVRTLVPTSQFSSFILWHPDMPVDESRDEYFRSLTEYTRLAHEIHKMEDLPL